MRKTIIWTIAVLGLLQWMLPYAIPLSEVYHNRMDYNIVKDNIHDIDDCIEQVKRDIKRKHVNEYLILLGDSVLYGSPGNSDQVVNAFMRQQSADGKAFPTVYNLALPGNQIGDLYTMLLKMDKAGISTDHVLINVRYASFAPRGPFDLVVFWLTDDLRQLDPEAYGRIQPMINEASQGVYSKYKDKVRHQILPAFKVYGYKDYLYDLLDRKWKQLSGRPVPDDCVIGGDPRPWYMKDPDDMRKYIESSEMQSQFTDTPFKMNDDNIDVYFMNKIISHLSGKHLTIVLTGTNHTLLKAYIGKRGYQDNLQRLDDFFHSKPARYVNLDGIIPDDEFVDHTHLTADGNRRLGSLLMELDPLR